MSEAATAELSTAVFEVNKSQWTETRVQRSTLSTDLAPGEVILEVDRFALTSNNITYCVTGDMLGYWKFFPTESGWGRIPAMGFANVIASNAEGIEVGERVWGFFPMGSHLKIQAGAVTPFNFKDVSPHRDGLAPIYATFERCAANPFYSPDYEDLEMLLKGLFTTSWLVEDFMFDNDHFDADQYLITSASSKTSIALAFAVGTRGLKRRVGLTSAGNVDFVKSLGCYEDVIAYDGIDSLDAGVPSIMVDMAGSARVRADAHNHFRDNMKFSSLVGATRFTEGGADEEQLPGAKPQFFFAPTQVEKRTRDWGPGEVQKRIANQLRDFMDYCGENLKVLRMEGGDAMNESFQTMLSGKASPSEGYVISMASEAK